MSGSSSLGRSTDPSALPTLDASSPGEQPPASRSLAGRLRKPTQIGQYQILEVVGAGGMGIVCSAYDRQLDRKVAIKLIRDEVSEPDRAYVRRVRLLREAQALAKLSHPNVVVVHDVGSHDGTIYMAMEFVEGRDLARWLAEERPSWSEIIEHYICAAEGLAAAHRRGITHRDFKPQNVLVGNDGRVRVADFGLAKAHELVEAESADGAGDSAEVLRGSGGMETSGSERLTHADRCMGTPAYMAPETVLGEGATPASDQFSFGVSLYESLYGALPFGEGEGAIWKAAEGTLPESPKDAAVPRWVHSILSRMLLPRPAQRYPSMDAVIAALRADPRVRRRKQWRIVTMVAAIGFGFAGFGLSVAGEGAPCTSSESLLADHWGDLQRVELRAAFDQVGGAHARETAVRVIAFVDDYAEAWSRASREICRATHVQGVQSSELLDVRMACLQRQRVRLNASVAVLSSVDGRGVGEAVGMVEAFDDPQRCVSATFDEIVPLPETSADRALVREVDDAVERARALILLQRWEEAWSVLESLVPLDQIAHLPTRAELALVRGDALVKIDPQQAEEVLQQAALLAARTGASSASLEARAWHSLMLFVGARQRRTQEALGLRWALESAAARAGTTEAKADVEDALARIHIAAGQNEEALRFARAHVLWRREHGDLRTVEGIEALRIAGIAALRLGEEGNVARLEQARGYAEEALALSREVLGDEHPRLVGLGSLLAGALTLQGESEAAEHTYRTAISLAERASESSASLPAALVGLASNLRGQGRIEEAADAYARAEELFARLERHAELWGAHRFHLDTLVQGELWQRALEAQERVRSWAPHFPSEAQARGLVVRCRVLWKLDQREEAQSACREALTMTSEDTPDEVRLTALALLALMAGSDTFESRLRSVLEAADTASTEARRRAHDHLLALERRVRSSAAEELQRRYAELFGRRTD